MVSPLEIILKKAFVVTPIGVDILTDCKACLFLHAECPICPQGGKYETIYNDNYCPSIEKRLFKGLK